MELDLQSLSGLHLHVYSCIHWLRPRNPATNSALIYEGAIMVSLDLWPLTDPVCLLVEGVGEDLPIGPVNIPPPPMIS